MNDEGPGPTATVFICEFEFSLRYVHGDESKHIRSYPSEDLEGLVASCTQKVVTCSTPISWVHRMCFSADLAENFDELL